MSGGSNLCNASPVPLPTSDRLLYVFISNHNCFWLDLFTNNNIGKCTYSICCCCRLDERTFFSIAHWALWHNHFYARCAFRKCSRFVLANWNFECIVGPEQRIFCLLLFAIVLGRFVVQLNGRTHATRIRSYYMHGHVQYN